MKSPRREVRHGRMTKNESQGSRKAEETSQSLISLQFRPRANHSKQLIYQARKSNHKSATTKDRGMSITSYCLFRQFKADQGRSDKSRFCQDSQFLKDLWM